MAGSTYEKALSRQQFQDVTNVSRETLDRLQIYADTLIAWQARTNLISNASAADIWRRHFLDSAQLAAHIPAAAKTLIDFGSGAGFPGLVLAILTGLEVTLVEATARKAAFLTEVARRTDASVTVRTARIESLPPAHFDIITARALTAVDGLCRLSAPFFAANSGVVSKESTIALFLKGQNVAEELTLARKQWTLETEFLLSVSDPSGVILRITTLSPR